MRPRRGFRTGARADTCRTFVAGASTLPAEAGGATFEPARMQIKLSADACGSSVGTSLLIHVTLRIPATAPSFLHWLDDHRP
jgi:hypothetical protein